MGGVHGDEPCGVKAVESLWNTLKVDRGVIYLIYGNPRAIELNVRQTEMNLNRAFREITALNTQETASYERQRAEELMPILLEADVLLDIHSSATSDSVPFIICEPNGYDIASRLPFEIVSSGWDEFEPGGTDAFVNAKGGIGVCIECGEHANPQSVRRAVDAVGIFLRETGAVTDPTYISKTLSQIFLRIDRIHITRTDFRLARVFKDFEALVAGSLIGYDGEETLTSPDDEFIVFSRNRAGSGEEAFLLAKKI
jgi:succinylglutamate desuccinylase